MTDRSKIHIPIHTSNVKIEPSGGKQKTDIPKVFRKKGHGLPLRYAPIMSIDNVHYRDEKSLQAVRKMTRGQHGTVMMCEECHKEWQEDRLYVPPGISVSVEVDHCSIGKFGAYQAGVLVELNHSVEETPELTKETPFVWIKPKPKKDTEAPKVKVGERWEGELCSLCLHKRCENMACTRNECVECVCICGDPECLFDCEKVRPTL